MYFLDREIYFFNPWSFSSFIHNEAELKENKLAVFDCTEWNIAK